MTVDAAEEPYVLGNDVLQLGRADSGVASPRSAAWALANPAALVDLDRRLDLTLFIAWLDIELKPKGLAGNPFDGALDARDTLYIPSGGIVWPLDEGRRGTLAAGLYGVGGGYVNYDESRMWIGKLFYGNHDRRFELERIKLAVGYGYRFGNGWALGAGLQGSLIRFRTDQFTLRLRTAEAANAWDEAYGVGFNVGVYRRWDRFSVGACYKSPQWSETIDAYGDLLKASVDYAHTFRVGVAYRPVERVELTLDYECQKWSHASPFKNRVLQSGLEWGDLNAVKVGLEWKVTDRLRVMMGYAFAEPVVDEDHLFVSAFVPPIIEDSWSAAVSYDLNAHHTVHLGYLRSAENAMVDTGHGDILSHFSGGSKLTESADTMALGYTYRF